MKRPVTEEDLTADPSLATIGVKVGDEYDFEESPADEARVPKFDPFTGAPLAQPDSVDEKPADEPAPEAEKVAEEASPEIEEHAAEDNQDHKSEESAPEIKVDEDSIEKNPITYAEILERGFSLNKIEAANLHPGISQIAQWGDLVERQEFKPAE